MLPVRTEVLSSITMPMKHLGSLQTLIRMLPVRTDVSSTRLMKHLIVTDFMIMILPDRTDVSSTRLMKH